MQKNCTTTSAFTVAAAPRRLQGLFLMLVSLCFFCPSGLLGPVLTANMNMTRINHDM